MGFKLSWHRSVSAAPMMGRRFRQQATKRSRKVVAGLLSLSMIASVGLGTALVTAPAAQAAAIGSVNISAAVSDHIGVSSMGGTTIDGDASSRSNCVTYQPADTSTSYTIGGETRYTATTFVSSGAQALTGHGQNSRCPSGNQVTVSGNNAQSAVGISPSVAQTVSDGVPFSLGKVTHYNNPVSSDTEYFTGKLEFQLSGFDAQNVLTFPWQMWETPNADQQGCPVGRWKGNGNCQDEIKFTSQFSDTILTKDGLKYRLVIGGFIPTSTATCPASPGNTAPVNDFWTNENAATSACVYASLIQIRTLTVNKITAGSAAPGNQAFAFTSNGALDGSPWKAGSASVTPTTVGTPVQVFQKELLRADTVTLTEKAVSDPRWSLSGMACTESDANGNAQPLAGASYSPTTGVITLANVGAPPSTSKPEITCNFTNTFKAGNLKISKVLSDPAGGFNGPATLPYIGTYACGGSYNGPFSVPAGGSVTINSIPVGSSCSVTESAPTGNLKNASFQWAAPTYAPNAVTIADGVTSNVTITNSIVQNMGTFTVQKVVKDAAGSSAGFQGGTSRIFPVNYTCTLAGTTSAPKTLNATTAGPVSSDPIPTGSSCVLSENLTAAAGDFGSDPSYEWVGNTGTFAPASPITIGTADKPVNVTLTNTFKRNLGSLEIAKNVVDPSGGYTGGNTQTFTGTYTCGSAAPVAFSITNGASKVVSTTIPVGTSCTVSETAPTGGLANTSYQWAAASYAPSAGTVSIPKTGTGLVTITNSVIQNSGKFSVAKLIDGPGGYTGSSTRAFSVHYDCTLPNGPVVKGDLSVTTAQVVSSGNIPAGYSCVLSEPTLATAPGDFIGNDSSYEWVPSTPGSFAPSNTITIGNGTTVAVNLTNKYIRQFGSLNLAKVVSGDGYTGGTAENFSVTYDCGGGFTGTVKLAAGANKTVNNLPANSICTVSEVPPAGNLDAAHKWGTPSWDAVGNKVTIAKNATVNATVTNPTIAIFGTVSVTKAITGGGVNSGATFPITVTCASANYAKTFTIKAGENATTTPLPVGTACSVTEGTRPTDQFVDDSYAWGAAPAAQNVTVATENQNVQVTVTNTTVRVYGSLTVSKTLSDPDGVYAGAPNNGAPFTGTWTCTYGTAEPVKAPWSVAAGASVKVSSNILLGSRCTVAEDALTGKPSTDTSYSWLPPVLSPADGVAVLSAAAPNGAVSVANAITRSTGLFTVAKSVVGPAGGYADGAQFPFTWACTGTDIGWAGASGNFALTNGGAWGGPTQAIPAGAACTVTEGANPAPNTSYTWDGVAFSSVGATGVQDNRSYAFKIPAGGKTPTPVNVTAANTISQKFATVNVAKVTSAGYDGATKFAITVDCGAAGSFPVSILGGTSANITVPLGSECSVSEATRDGGLVDGSYAWDTAVFAPASFTVTQTQTPISVVVTNPTKRVYGSVDVSKTLTGLGSVVDSDRDYTGTWTCQYGTDKAVTGPFSIKADTTSAPTGNILVGSLCSVSEDALSAPSADPSYVWAAPVYSAPTAVPASGTAHLSVTNEVKRNTGSILVTKKLAGATDGMVAGSTFDIIYSCSAPGVGGAMTGSKAVSVGQETLLLDNVPFGWSCVIDEGSPTAAQLKDASYSWGKVAIDSSPVVLSSGNNPAKVSVTNTIVRNLGSVNLQKIFTGPTGVVDTAKVYSGTFTCTYGDATVKTGKWSTTAGAASVELATDLPVTTSCTAVEDALSAPSADPSYVWAAPAVTTVSVVPGAPAVIDVTNTLVRNTGSLTVSKKVTGSDSELAGYTGGTDKNFTASYVCTVPDHPEFTAQVGSVAVANGGTETLATGIPAGWSCAVGESTPSATLLKDTSFAWGAPVFTPASVTVAPGTAAAFAVENPITRVYGSVDVRKVLVGPAGSSAVASDRIYTGSWTCVYGDEPAVVGTWSTTAQGAPIQVSGKVLLNSDCTISEDKLSAPVPGDPSYQWTSSVGTGDSVAAGKPAHLVMTNTYVRDTAAFTVTKKIDGDGYTGDDAAKNFTVTYNCGVGFSGSVDLAKDQSATITEIPSQSACAIGETAPAGNLLPAYKWIAPTWSANVVNGSFTVNKAATTDVVLTNHTEKIFGQVSVAKALAGADGVAQGTLFTFNVSCTDGYQGSFSVGAYQSPKTTGNVAVGSQCTVTEVPPTGGLVDGSFGWGATPEPQTVTITEQDQVVPVVMTNTVERRYGSLNIGKVLTDPDAVYAGGDFTGTWTCSYGQAPTAIVQNGTWSATAGQPAKSVGKDILIGSTCKVTEDALAAHPSADTSYVWSASYAPGTDVVLSTANPSATVTVTNTVTRLTGSFAVTKTLAGSGVSDGVVPDSTFPFSYVCSGTGWAGAKGTFTLKAGEGSWNPTTVIPAGASCTVTEGDNPATTGPSYTWDGVAFTATGSATEPVKDGRSVTFTIPAPVDGATQTVGINAENSITRKFGDVVVTKTIAGETQGYNGTQPFSITLNCENAAPITLTMTGTAGGNSKSASLPLGTKCSVAEAALGTDGLKDSSYTWGTPTITNETFTVSSSTTAIEVAVVNTIDRVNGSVDVTKVLTGSQGVVDPARDYTGTWTCTYPGDPAKTGQWTVKAGASTAPVTGILLNSACTVTESALTAPSVDPSYRWTAATLSGATVIDAATPAHLLVTNNVVRDTGSISVTKAVTGAVGGYVGGTQPVFDIAYACKVDGVATPLSGHQLVANGQTAVLSDSVPFGWACTISEMPTSGNLADGSFTWGTPVFSAQDVVLSAETTAVTVKVENPVERVYGSFNVAKVVSGPGSGSVPADRVFAGNAVCTYGSDAPVTKAWEATTAKPAVVSGVLVGSNCVVSETAPTAGPSASDPSLIWLPAKLPADVVVAAAPKVPTATVENPTDQLFGTFGITKTVTGARAGVDAGAKYSFNWTCTPVGFGSPVSGSATVADGELWQLPSIISVPLGSSCSVSEAPERPALVDSAYTWEPVKLTVAGAPGTQVNSATTFTVPSDGTAVLVTADNPIKQSFGTFSVAKSSDPASGTEVKVGQKITYTLKAVNTSAVPVHDVLLTDDLTSVLASGTLTGGFTATEGKANLADQQLSWNLGTLAPGATQTLTYSVVVKNGSENKTITNVVLGRGDVPPSSCASAVAKTSGPGSGGAAVSASAPCGTTHVVSPPPVVPPVVPPAPPVVPPVPPLASTGVTGIWFLGLGGGLLLLGAILMVVTRRKDHRA